MKASAIPMSEAIKIQGEKVDFIAASAWCLKELFNRNMVYGFSKRDHSLLRLLNKGYIAAYNNQGTVEGWNKMIMSDSLCKYLSDAGFGLYKILVEEIILLKERESLKTL